MATDTIPPFLRSQPAEVSGTLTEHVLVYEVTGEAERWYAWCPVSLADGVGFDLERVRWSKFDPTLGPLTPLLPKGEGPDIRPPEVAHPGLRPGLRPSSATWRWTRVPVFAYDAAYVLP